MAHKIPAQTEVQMSSEEPSYLSTSAKIAVALVAIAAIGLTYLQIEYGTVSFLIGLAAANPITTLVISLVVVGAILYVVIQNESPDNEADAPVAREKNEGHSKTQTGYQRNRHIPGNKPFSQTASNNPTKPSPHNNINTNTLPKPPLQQNNQQQNIGNPTIGTPNNNNAPKISVKNPLGELNPIGAGANQQLQPPMVHNNNASNQNKVISDDISDPNSALVPFSSQNANAKATNNNNTNASSSSSDTDQVSKAKKKQAPFPIKEHHEPMKASTVPAAYLQLQSEFPFLKQVIDEDYWRECFRGNEADLKELDFSDVTSLPEATVREALEKFKKWPTENDDGVSIMLLPKGASFALMEELLKKLFGGDFEIVRGKYMFGKGIGIYNNRPWDYLFGEEHVKLKQSCVVVLSNNILETTRHFEMTDIGSKNEQGRLDLEESKKLLQMQQAAQSLNVNVDDLSRNEEARLNLFGLEMPQYLFVTTLIALTYAKSKQHLYADARTFCREHRVGREKEKVLVGCNPDKPNQIFIDIHDILEMGATIWNLISSSKEVRDLYGIGGQVTIPMQEDSLSTQGLPLRSQFPINYANTPTSSPKSSPLLLTDAPHNEINTSSSPSAPSKASQDKLQKEEAIISKLVPKQQPVRMSYEEIKPDPIPARDVPAQYQSLQKEFPFLKQVIDENYWRACFAVEDDTLAMLDFSSLPPFNEQTIREALERFKLWPTEDDAGVTILEVPAGITEVMLEKLLEQKSQGELKVVRENYIFRMGMGLIQKYWNYFFGEDTKPVQAAYRVVLSNGLLSRTRRITIQKPGGVDQRWSQEYLASQACMDRIAEITALKKEFMIDDEERLRDIDTRRLTVFGLERPNYINALSLIALTYLKSDPTNRIRVYGDACTYCSEILPDTITEDRVVIGAKPSKPELITIFVEDMYLLLGAQDIDNLGVGGQVLIK